MKKAGILLALFVWFIGMVSGIGYALYYNEGTVIIAGLLIGVAYSIPTVKRLWKTLKD